MTNRYKPEGMLEKTKENKSALGDPQALHEAWRTGQILEAPVLLCDNRMRLHVDLGCMHGIIEHDEALYCRRGETVKDIAIITRVGKTVAFKIIGFGEENGERIALLSRREVQRDCVREFLSTLLPGDIIPARVTHLENYGAFVDIGCGVSSLLSIDCISVSRIAHPRDRLTCGMFLYVAIKSIDKELGRIFVTLKELLGTWEENVARFEAGETVVGRVRSIESYGIFVELTPNLAGLAELRGSGNTPVRCAVGDTAAVFIKSMIPERMKIKLIIIDAYPANDPPEPLRYYIDTEKVKHIDYWEYSPAASTRLIETIF
ncbi:MAG: 30S ribosomal protein S1 [Clostridia bacterium]|nr:30S ribosomal protein S1 [Clostridia bacterium]